ncbi:early nodulin-like protein 3 [Cucumis melo]|uniref:Early nodulin-like protein 3 n=1 Tax=Cucumis melo TaxID=3656 RepID=A0A1S3CJA1_CUCME|nr:early nodulin-like protein 3 [Cucumis melo]
MMGKRSNNFGIFSQKKACVNFVVKLFGVLMFVQKVCGVEFQVGGSKGVWGVPSDPNAQSLNQWAESRRFQIGDSLVFNYQGGQDSVLLVNEDDYKNCHTESPIKHFSDGHTVIKFEKSGPHYFISGIKDNCLKNEKLVVVVLADRSRQYSSPPPAPATGSQPPEASVQMNPTPSPIAEEPPANNNGAASSSIVTFVGLAGMLATSTALLL